MHNFTYNIPTKVYFGAGQMEGNLGRELAACGKKVLLVYGGGSIKKSGLYDKVIAEIKEAGLEVTELSGIDPNPRIDSVREGAKICKEKGIDVVLAVGGGSTIDASKFIAAGACVDFDPWLFLTEWRPIEKTLPIVTVLTLSATGSEMDAVAVISNMETNDKIAGGGQLLYPKVSFLDPQNTYTVSKYQTACGSADILSHIFEVYFNMDQGLFMLDTVMEGLMKTVIKYAPVALEEPDNYEARANLMWAASWAINGFIEYATGQDWACHSIEHELSAYYDITHGLGLAIVTPRWMKKALNEETVSKFVQYGVNVWGIDKNLAPMEIAEIAIAKTEEFLFGTLGLDSTLGAVGIDSSKFELMATKACYNEGTLKCLATLTIADVVEILNNCL
ncbi:MAG: iron-containing alcohol dehydrogenase, partial [Firmicutes bacterium]|nr:iron-containing alcohol dehydrogenase [Bacillota bacterium]